MNKKLEIMFDQIVDLVKNQLGKDPQLTSSIPGNQNEEVNREVAGSIHNGLQEHANTNGEDGITSMFSGNGSSGGLTDSISGGLIGNLTSKLGLNGDSASAIAAAVPGILQKLIHKTNDPNDSSINLSGVLGNLFGR